MSALPNAEEAFGMPSLAGDDGDGDANGGQTLLDKLEALRDEEGEPIAAEAVGRIFIRTPASMAGYWQAPEATEEVLREARTRQSAIATRMESAQNRFKMREMYAGSRIQDAFSRFEVMERRADLAEGRAEVAGMGAAKSLDEELAELRSSDKVEAELAAMKARTAAGPPALFSTMSLAVLSLFMSAISSSPPIVVR